MNLSAITMAELEHALLSPAQIEAQWPFVSDGVAALPDSTDPVACKLEVARELLMRRLQAKLRAGPLLDEPETVKEWLRLYCMHLEHEVFAVLYLDAHFVLLDAVRHFNGTLTQASVYPREIVKAALQRNAAAVVLLHNHPSGNSEPSLADQFLTQALIRSLRLVDVRVMDHFVVAGRHVVSFAERGLL